MASGGDVVSLAIVTEWKVFRSPDFELIRARLREPVVFDGRNICSPDSLARRGLAHYGIGRTPAAPS